MLLLWKQNTTDTGASLLPLQLVKRPEETMLEGSGKGHWMEFGQLPAWVYLWAILHGKIQSSIDKLSGSYGYRQFPADTCRSAQPGEARGGGAEAGEARAGGARAALQVLGLWAVSLSFHQCLYPLIFSIVCTWLIFLCHRGPWAAGVSSRILLACPEAAGLS